MIELVITWDGLINSLGAVVMIAFGLWVLTLTPQSRSTRMLALFAVAFGAVYAPSNIVVWTGAERFSLWLPYKIVLYALGGVSVLALLREMLAPLGRKARQLWRYAAGIAAGIVLLPLAVSAMAGFPGYEEAAGGAAPWRLLPVIGESVSFGFFMGTLLALPLMLAWLHRHPPEGVEEETRTRGLLIGAALIFQPALNAGFVAVAVARGADLLAPLGNNLVLRELLFLLGFLVLVGIWLANARAVPGWSGEARNMALFVLAVLAAGMAQPVFLDAYISEIAQGPLWGIGRLLSVLILGYAILQHEVLGIETKFRWGVSKTAVTGVFVAVFFIVSEGAQAVFEDFAGNEFLGILAAGGLLFALAPIQRAADRIAKHTVPSPGTPAPSRAGERRLALYRSAVKRFLADGAITDEEEQELFDLAEELGIGAGEAMRIRREIRER